MGLKQGLECGRGDMNFEISMHDQIPEAEVLKNYRENHWSTAQKPVI